MDADRMSRNDTLAMVDSNMFGVWSRTDQGHFAQSRYGWLRRKHCCCTSTEALPFYWGYVWQRQKISP